MFSILNYDDFLSKNSYNSRLNNLKLACPSSKTMVRAIIITLKTGEGGESYLLTLH